MPESAMRFYLLSLCGMCLFTVWHLTPRIVRNWELEQQCLSLQKHLVEKESQLIQYQQLHSRLNRHPDLRNQLDGLPMSMIVSQSYHADITETEFADSQSEPDSGMNRIEQISFQLIQQKRTYALLPVIAIILLMTAVLSNATIAGTDLKIVMKRFFHRLLVRRYRT